MDSLMNLLNNLMLRIGVWLQTATVGMDPTAENELLDVHDKFMDDWTHEYMFDTPWYEDPDFSTSPGNDFYHNSD